MKSNNLFKYQWLFKSYGLISTFSPTADQYTVLKLIG